MAAPSHRLTHRLSSLVAMAVMAATPLAPAMAQETSSAAQEGEEAAEPSFQELIKSAKAAYDDGDYTTAIARLLYAYRLDPHPRLLLNVARSYEKLDDCRSALVYYRAFLREPDAEPQLIEQVEETLAEQTDDCNSYDERASGRLIVHSTPRGARLTIDGTAYELTPFEVAGLPAGKHTVRLEKEGFAPYEEQVRLSADADRTVEATLKRPTRAVLAPAPEPEPDPLLLARDEGPDQTNLYIAGGITAVGAGLFAMGMIYDLSVIPATDEERERLVANGGDQAAYQALTDERAGEATMALVGYIGGGLLLAGGGGWLAYQLWKQSEEEAAQKERSLDLVELRPTFDRGAVGLGLHGRF